MKAKLHKPAPVDPEHFGDAAKDWPVYRHDPRFKVAPAGTVVEHPDCWYLVKQGVCEPADPECARKVGMTEEQIVARYEKYQLMDHGQFNPDPDKNAPDPSRLAVVES